MSKRRAWPLSNLLSLNRNAVTVYAALRWLSGDSRRLGTTRARISEVCGLYRDTITVALQALDTANWVRVNYGRQGKRTWYRLSFPVPGFFPVPAKTRHSKRPASGKNPPQQTVSCTGKNPPLSLRERRAVPAAPSPALSSGGAAPALRVADSTAQLERERLAAIRAAREASNGNADDFIPVEVTT